MFQGDESARKREKESSSKKPRKPYAAPRFERTTVAKQVFGKGKGSLTDTLDKLKSPPKK